MIPPSTAWNGMDSPWVRVRPKRSGRLRRIRSTIRKARITTTERTIVSIRLLNSMDPVDAELGRRHERPGRALGPGRATEARGRQPHGAARADEGDLQDEREPGQDAHRAGHGRREPVPGSHKRIRRSGWGLRHVRTPLVTFAGIPCRINRFCEHHPDQGVNVDRVLAASGICPSLGWTREPDSARKPAHLVLCGNVALATTVVGGGKEGNTCLTY